MEMLARGYWRAVTRDESGLLDRLLAILRQQEIRFCVIGGQGVNAYAEPMVSLDLDIVVAISDLERVETMLREHSDVERVPHSTPGIPDNCLGPQFNVSQPDSDLRVQIQTDPRYGAFVDRAEQRDVLGIMLPVAHVEDLLQGKIWAVSDPERRPSKRQKDLADIARLVEADPTLRARVPVEILQRLF